MGTGLKVAPRPRFCGVCDLRTFLEDFRVFWFCKGRGVNRGGETKDERKKEIKRKKEVDVLGAFEVLWLGMITQLKRGHKP